MEIGEPAARVTTPRDGKRTSSPEEMAVAVPPGDGVLGDGGEEFSDEDEELYDTDVDSDSDMEFGDGEAAGSTDVTVVPVESLGTKARFASVESTAGFMLLGAFPAADVQSGRHHHHHGGEITVHYRYARFTTDESGGGGSKLHTVRFLVPSSHAAFADAASSLRLAGAAMADIAYPRRFTAQLQKLWSNLVAAAPVRVPPWAARIEVTVSVGILRPRDRTPERMASMRAALAAEPHVRPSLRDAGVVMSLPAPVKVEEDVRPAKRRRPAAAGVDQEECAICFEVLERGLAAWPRCVLGAAPCHGGSALPFVQE